MWPCPGLAMVPKHWSFKHLCITFPPCCVDPAQALLWKCGHSPKGDRRETRLLHGLRLVSSLQFPSFKILGPGFIWLFSRPPQSSLLCCSALQMEMRPYTFN